MEKRMFMFAVFVFCSVLIACKKLPPIGSRDFQRRQTVARHGTMKVNDSEDLKGLLSGSKRIKRTADHRDQDAPEFLLYIVGNDIKKLTLGDASVESTLVPGKQFDGSPLFLDFNYKENRLYWATSKSIYRSFLSDTSNIQTVHRDLPLVQGLAVDWLGNNIYWLGQRHIMVSRTDGRFKKTLVGIQAWHRNPLVLDPEKGFMYWFGVLRSEGRIYKLPMYQTEYPYDAIAIDLPKPSQFAIDYFDRKLYWTAGNYRRSSATGIKSHKLDLDDTIDGQRTEVLKGLNGISPPTSLSVSEHSIYWVDEHSTYISMTNKTIKDTDMTHTIKNIKVNAKGVRSLKVVHRNIQKDYIGYDECSAWTRCSHLCLSDPDMHLFRCECPDNMTAVGKWYWNKTCACPTGQFMDAKGDCNYLEAPWNVIAIKLNTTAIKLTWLPPKVRQPGKMWYYIFLAIYPNGIPRWPLSRTTSTSFVISHLKSSVRYTFAVSVGVHGRRILTDSIRLLDGIPPLPTTSRLSTANSSLSASTGSTPASPSNQLQLQKNNNESFPYWAIGVTVVALGIIIFAVVLLVRRYKRGTRQSDRRSHRCDHRMIDASTTLSSLKDPLET
ncbi:low-density lipoprotein receptor-related protein 1B-like [Porites lutea]|uniref:low-density lipoprotein receptor-related protein 1B-like n=1 Tax=Porites lutea TaxID=51062 RepID=UPI003CC5AB5F